jgi:hypothetical protein
MSFCGGLDVSVKSGFVSYSSFEHIGQAIPFLIGLDKSKDEVKAIFSALLCSNVLRFAITFFYKCYYSIQQRQIYLFRKLE